MYRQYENPGALEERLKELELEYSKAVENGADEDRLISLSEDIAELKDRINHAWQDDEYDSEN